MDNGRGASKQPPQSTTSTNLKLANGTWERAAPILAVDLQLANLLMHRQVGDDVVFGQPLLVDRALGCWEMGSEQGEGQGWDRMRGARTMACCCTYH